MLGEGHVRWRYISSGLSVLTTSDLLQQKPIANRPPCSLFTVHCSLATCVAARDRLSLSLHGMIAASRITRRDIFD